MTTTDVTAQRQSNANVPLARVLPAPPMTLADVLDAVIDQLDEFLGDLYEHGLARGDSAVLWANGAPAVLRVYTCATAIIRLKVPWNVPRVDRSFISSVQLVQSSGRSHPNATAREQTLLRSMLRPARSMLL